MWQCVHHHVMGRRCRSGWPAGASAALSSGGAGAGSGGGPVPTWSSLAADTLGTASQVRHKPREVVHSASAPSRKPSVTQQQRACRTIRPVDAAGPSCVASGTSSGAALGSVKGVGIGVESAVPESLFSSTTDFQLPSTDHGVFELSPAGTSPGEACPDGDPGQPEDTAAGQGPCCSPSTNDAGGSAPVASPSDPSHANTADDVLQPHCPQIAVQQQRPSRLQELPPAPLPRVAWDPGPVATEAGCGQAPQPSAPQGATGPASQGRPALTPGGRFRTALRRCRSLDELEALLETQRPPPSQPAQGEGSGGDGGCTLDFPSDGQLPTAEGLSVPSLCAVFSALPRLPEAFTPGGCRRLRGLVSRRLTPLVLAVRNDLDAAAPAVMVQALAAMGPGVLDVRGGGELLEVLAEAGLAACRLPPEFSWRPQQRAQGTDALTGGEAANLSCPACDAVVVESELAAQQQGVCAAQSDASSPVPLQPPTLVCEPGAHPQQLPVPPPFVRLRARPPPGQYGHSPRSYSMLLWGMAKLGYRPEEQWLARYTAASVPWLRAFPPRDLATCAWALAVIGYRPGEAWLAALLAAWPVHRSGGAAASPQADGEPQGLAGAGSGARAGAGPGAAAVPGRRRADAHSLSLLLWALWQLGVAAPGDWVDGALADCASARYRYRPAGACPFPGATCQSLGLIAYSLARMRHTPQPAVRGALVEASQPLLQRGSAQDLVLLLVGVAHWPRDGGGGSSSSDSSGSGCSPPSRSTPPVPAAWLQQLCMALLPRLRWCGAQALVLSLSALAHLGFRPGSSWLDAHEAALRYVTIRGQLDGKAPARVAAAWARLRHRPTRRLLERLLKLMLMGAAAAPGEGQDEQRRKALSARLFAEGLYGAAILVASIRDVDGHNPRRQTANGSRLPHVGRSTPSADGDPWVAAAGVPAAGGALSPLLPAIHVRSLLSSSASRLEYGYLDEAVLHLRAWRLLRVAPHHQWLANLAAVARAKLRAAPPGVVLELLCLLSWPGWRRFREQQLAAGDAAERRSGRAPWRQQQQLGDGDGEPAELAGAALPLSNGLRVSTSLLSAVAARLCAQLEELSAEQVAEAVEALAALRVPLSRGLLRRLLEAVRARSQAAAVVGGAAWVAPGPSQGAAAPSGGEMAGEGLEGQASGPVVRLRSSEALEAQVYPHSARGAWDAPDDVGARGLRAVARLAAVVDDAGLQREAESLLEWRALQSAAYSGSVVSPAWEGAGVQPDPVWHTSAAHLERSLGVP